MNIYETTDYRFLVFIIVSMKKKPSKIVRVPWEIRTNGDTKKKK